MKQGRKPFGYYQDERAVIEIIKLKRRKRKGYMGPLSFAAITRELNAEGYRTQTGKLWASQTIKNVLSRIEAQESNRCKQYSRKTQLNASDYLKPAQIRTCRESLLRPIEKVVFETLLGAGLRASELCALQIRDIGVFDGKRQIDVRRGKGAKQRSVIIGKRLAALLVEYLTTHRKDAGRKQPVFLNIWGKELSYSDLHYMLKILGKRAGIDYLHPHILRHTFATLYNYKTDAFFIRDQLGHANLNTTAIYAKTNTANKIRVVDNFEDRLEQLTEDSQLQENDSKKVQSA